MATRAMIEDFMAQKKLVLIRESQKTPVKGFSIDKELLKKGYTVTVLYLEDESFSQKLKNLKESATGAIIVVPAHQTEKAIQTLVETPIKRVWIQKDSENQQAISLCNKNGITAIHGECIMMFAEPVTSVHAFHRWIWKILGKLPS